MNLEKKDYFNLLESEYAISAIKAATTLLRKTAGQIVKRYLLIDQDESYEQEQLIESGEEQGAGSQS